MFVPLVFGISGGYRSSSAGAYGSRSGARARRGIIGVANFKRVGIVIIVV
jgi:hypothetical protein